jgi:hypothetical protein
MRVVGMIAQHAILATVSRQRYEAATRGLVKFLESAWAECFRGALKPASSVRTPGSVSILAL